MGIYRKACGGCSDNGNCQFQDEHDVEECPMVREAMIDEELVEDFEDFLEGERRA